MIAAEHKVLINALAHLKKVDGKLDMTLDDEVTDQYVFSAHTKVQAALVSLERALHQINKASL